MVCKIGPPVEGDNFFGREKEITNVWKKIADGNNFLFPSPRRVGKSSFAKRILKDAKQNKWHTIEINLEYIHTEADFLETFVKELQKLSWWDQVKDSGGKLLQGLKKLKPAVDLGGVKVSVDWENEKTNVYQQFEKTFAHDKPTLIFLDELGVFLNSITTDENKAKPAEQLLHWLRKLRQVSGTQVRWMFCSSVSIESFTHRYLISDTINDLLPYRLKAFSSAESIAFLQALSSSAEVSLSEENCKYIVDKIDYCLPFFLQLIFQKVETMVTTEGFDLTIETIDESYSDLLNENHFNTWVERIERQYKPNASDLKLILKYLSQEKGGASRAQLMNRVSTKYPDPEQAEELLNKLLYILKNDGYLDIREGKYLFRSPLLRDFWLTRFVR